MTVKNATASLENSFSSTEMPGNTELSSLDFLCETLALKQILFLKKSKLWKLIFICHTKNLLLRSPVSE